MNKKRNYNIKKIIAALSKISLATVFNTVSGIVRTKIFAVILGTAGVGLASQLFNFSGLIFTIGTVGIPLGFTKYVSLWDKEGKYNEIKDALKNFIIILFTLGLVLLIFTIFFSKQISSLLLDSDLYSSLIIITALAFPFSAITSIFDACLRGLKQFSKYVKITIFTSIISLAVSIISVLLWGINGLPFSIVIPSIITLGLYLKVFNKNNLFNIKDVLHFKIHISKSFKMILKIGVASLIDLVIQQVTLIVLRSTLIKYLGIDNNGIYQAVFAISNNYISLFSVTLWVYILPILSELNSNEEINKEINNTLKLTLLIIFPIITLTFVLRHYFIILLFSPKFIPASDFLIFNFIGDYIRAISWVIGAWLIPKTKLKLWLSLGISFNFSYFIVFYFLINYLVSDLRSIVVAYTFASFIHLFLSLIYSIKVNNFKFRNDVLKLVIITSICFFFLMILSNINLIWGYCLIIPVYFIWVKTSIKKEEFNKLLQLVKKKSMFKPD